MEVLKEGSYSLLDDEKQGNYWLRYNINRVKKTSRLRSEMVSEVYVHIHPILPHVSRMGRHVSDLCYLSCCQLWCYGNYHRRLWWFHLLYRHGYCSRHSNRIILQRENSVSLLRLPLPKFRRARTFKSSRILRDFYFNSYVNLSLITYAIITIFQ